MIDIGSTPGSMTEQEAMDLMVKVASRRVRGAQEVGSRAFDFDAALHVLRGLDGDVDPGSGSDGRLPVASGDPRGASAVPEPQVVGGFGKTSGFSYKEHLESVIAHGSPPVPLIRRILLGE